MFDITMQEKMGVVIRLGIGEDLELLIQDDLTGRSSFMSVVAEEANRRIELLIDSGEKAHWMGVEAALSRKHRLWLTEITLAFVESRAADIASFPPLTGAEQELSATLAAIQTRTSAVRDAARLIEISFAGLTSEEILAITEDDIINHVLWP